MVVVGVEGENRNKLGACQLSIFSTKYKIFFQTDKAQGRKDLKRSLQCLRECVKILSVQPLSTFPGQLYLGIEQSQNHVEEFIKSQLSK